MWTIVIGHATFCVVVVYNNVVARLRRSSGSLLEASQDLGADGWQTFRFVVWPVLSTALVAGGLLAFALSFDEVIVTTFTAGRRRRCRSSSSTTSSGAAAAGRQRRSIRRHSRHRHPGRARAARDARHRRHPAGRGQGDRGGRGGRGDGRLSREGRVSTTTSGPGSTTRPCEARRLAPGRPRRGRRGLRSSPCTVTVRPSSRRYRRATSGRAPLHRRLRRFALPDLVPEPPHPGAAGSDGGRPLSP